MAYRLHSGLTAFGGVRDYNSNANNKSNIRHNNINAHERNIYKHFLTRHEPFSRLNNSNNIHRSNNP